MDDERAVAGHDSGDADGAEGTTDHEAIETAGTVTAAGRRMITEDWAATILGLVLLVLVLAGVIAKGMVP